MVRALLLVLVSLPLFTVGCVYDYSKLSGRSSDAGTGLGGTGGVVGMMGTGGRLAGGTGGVTPASGGQIGTGTGGVTGGPGTGGIIVATGGSGSSGGTGGTGGTGGMNSGGVDGTGGSQDLGGAGGSGTGGSATPHILSIDFVGGYTVTSSATGGAGGAGGAAGAGGNGTGGSSTVTTVVSLPAMTAAEVAGVKPASRWNSAPGAVGSLAGLALSDGSATDATATWNSPKNSSSPGIWRIGYADAPGDVRMMNGYLDPLTTAMPATVTVSDLPTSFTAAGYDVYVYVTGLVTSGTRTYRYTIGTSTSTVSQVAPSATTFSGYVLAPDAGAGNYIVFRNVTGASFTLTATPGGGSQTRAPVNGIQIVSPTGS